MPADCVKARVGTAVAKGLCMLARTTALLAALLFVTVPACVTGGEDETDGHDDAEEVTAIEESESGERSAESISGTVTVGGTLRTTADLNLRTGPSTGHAVLHVIPAGARVTVVEAAPKSGWYRIEHAGARGWSFGAYLERVATTTPTCDATAKTGDYCGGDKVSHASSNTLYRCNGPGPAAVVSRCSAGCVVAPAGTDDHCASPAAESPSAEACPHVSSLLRWGLHPVASDRLRCAGVSSSRISQTIGNAAASAGTHAKDGTTGAGPYSAATDISVSGLSDAQVKTLIAKLDALGFAAFFRNPGHDGWPSYEARHVHAVFVGAKMKSSLQSQVWDFLAGRNGLASHSTYSFYQPPASVKAYSKALFLDAN